MTRNSRGEEWCASDYFAPPKAEVYKSKAQAGDPEVIGEIDTMSYEGKTLYPKFLIDATGRFDELLGAELITLQSHRDAMANRAQGIAAELETAWEDIAKKDAALKACVEALKLAIDTSYSEATNQVFKAAIKQAEGAMK